MAKQDEHRFNLRFDEDDENHRRVSAYLLIGNCKMEGYRS